MKQDLSTSIDQINIKCLFEDTSIIFVLQKYLKIENTYLNVKRKTDCLIIASVRKSYTYGPNSYSEQFEFSFISAQLLDI